MLEKLKKFFSPLKMSRLITEYMSQRKNSFHENVKQRKHFIFQEPGHAVYPHCSLIQKHDFKQ
jgi:hypothetical protein